MKTRKFSKVIITIVVCLASFIVIGYVYNKVKTYCDKPCDNMIDSLQIAINIKVDTIASQKAIIRALEAQLKLTGISIDSVKKANYTLLKQAREASYHDINIYPNNTYSRNDTMVCLDSVAYKDINSKIVELDGVKKELELKRIEGLQYKDVVSAQDSLIVSNDILINKLCIKTQYLQNVNDKNEKKITKLRWEAIGAGVVAVFVVIASL